MKRLRIAIFDDNEDRCESLVLLLQDAEGLELAGVYNDANTALQDITDSAPDLILMDIQMPGVGGIEAVKIIKKQFPEIQILMQTVFFDDELIFDSIKAGASGYILKQTSPERIVESIFDASEGGSPMTPSVARKVLDFFKTPLEKVSNIDYNLTKREMEVLTLLTKGKSYKMIADSLYISFSTVNTHVHNIYQKLHVNSIGEAVAKAIQKGIVNE